jgi:D-alanine-D-alanine ligase
MTHQRRVLLIIGSRTSEDRYGVESGGRVAGALRRVNWNVEVIHAREGRAILRRLVDHPPQLIVPVGFGTPCEDGHIFAAARLAGIPCAGPTSAAGSLMQDKAALSRFVDALFPLGSGVRSPRGRVLTSNLSRDETEFCIKSLGTPLVVKPAFGGSSEGLSVAFTYAEAIEAITTLVQNESKVLVQELEQTISHEISCTVLDGLDRPSFLPIVELRREDVPVLGREEKFGTAAFDRHIIPARLTADVAARVEKAVWILHDAVGAVGLTRTDILVLFNGEIVVLEMNGIPGLLESSIACDAARAAGISFENLCVRYAESAYIPRAEPNVWGMFCDRDNFYSGD